ncbi:MAG TPA: PspC domain-containing protein [Thermomicrobiales bacterium]|nr:PspC domain-containing protein [Thermomicrobiales bacterium]
MQDETYRTQDAGSEPPPVEPPRQEVRRLYRSRSDRMIGGVAGGMASYLGIDPVLSRLIWVALLFSGVGFLLYIIAWIIVPEAPEGMQLAAAPPASNQALRLIVGGGLVLIGAIFLLREIIPWFDEGVVWAAILVVVGIGILLKAVRT